MNRADVAIGPVYEVDLYRHGTCRILGRYAYHTVMKDRDHRYDIYLALVSGDGVRALIDTGMASVPEMNQGAGFLMSELISQQPGEDTLGILRQAGLTPEDIDYVLLTHYHFDHCSNLPLFTRAKVTVPARAWAAWRRDPKERPYLPDGLYEYLLGLEAEGRLFVLDEGLVRPGIGVKWVGGHTICSTFVYVNTPEGVAVFTGDTVQMYGNVDLDDIIHINEDEEQCRRALEIARVDADVLMPGHDPLVFERHPRGIHGHMRRV